MITSEKIDQLLPALLKARSKMQPPEKDGENTFHKYKYTTEHAWHDAVMDHLLDHGMCLTFDIRHCERQGTLTTVRGAIRLMHESGQFMEVDVVGEGEDKMDKAAYKAMTGMKKYGYALLFALPTTDDAEGDQNDYDRNKQELKRTTFRAAKTPAEVNAVRAEQGIPPVGQKDQGQINAERVAQDLPPIHSAVEKTAAVASYQTLFKVDPATAKAIKHESGTDYVKMKRLLDLALKNAPAKQEAKP